MKYHIFATYYCWKNYLEAKLHIILPMYSKFVSYPIFYSMVIFLMVKALLNCTENCHHKKKVFRKQNQILENLAHIANKNI